jgi:inhibitor of cysteine peptidase
MRNFIWLKIILSTALLFSAVVCAKAKVAPVATKEPAVYTQDKPVAVVTADQPEFIIKLKSNPTTGYTWFLRGYNIELLEPVAHSFQAPDSTTVGAPGFELWTFKVKPSAFVVPQQTSIRFAYSRPWEASESASQLMFRVTIVQKTLS